MICWTDKPRFSALDVAAALVEWAWNTDVSMPASCIAILSHLATELLARAPCGCLKLIKSCSPSVPAALSSSVVSRYVLRQCTTFSFGSASYCTNRITRGPSPTFLPFVSSPIWNSISSPLSNIMEILSLCNSDALLADVRAMSIHTLSERSRKLRNSSSGCVFMRSNTVSASQVSMYLGCGGFSLNMPFSSFTMSIFCPTGRPWTRLCLAEIADL